jgi:hypothetical protein
MMTLEDIELIKAHKDSALFLVFKKLCKEYREKTVDQLTKVSDVADMNFLRGKLVVLTELVNSVDFYAAFNTDVVAPLPKIKK